MKFIEMTGATLRQFVQVDEITAQDLDSSGLEDDCIVRVNQQGDIEIRRPTQWDVLGGLLGDFDERLKEATGLDWA